MRNWLIGLALAAAALFAGWYYASPLYAMNGLREAAESGNEAALEGSVDFPVLRENLKAELRAKITAELGDSLGDLGARFGMAMADQLIDGLITPEAIATLVRQGNVLPQSSDEAPAAQPEAAEWAIERNGLSGFTAQPSNGDTALVFERRGLGWKLVGIDLPAAEQN